MTLSNTQRKWKLCVGSGLRERYPIRAKCVLNSLVSLNPLDPGGSDRGELKILVQTPV